MSIKKISASKNKNNLINQQNLTKNYQNTNFRKLNNTSNLSTQLKKDSNVNITKKSRIRNAYNKSKETRAKLSSQQDGFDEDSNNKGFLEKKKNDFVQKQKKKVVAKVSASLFSTIFVPVLIAVAIVIVTVFIIPLLVTFIANNIADYASAIYDSVSSAFYVDSNGVVHRDFSNGTYTCSTSTDDLNVSYTSLTEDEFVEALTNGKPFQGSKKGQQYMIDNARLIYRKGIEMGVNPELAVLRADIEGYSPSFAHGLESYNNFWGFGCENDESPETCTKFSTFEDGLEHFNNWVIKYRDKTSSDAYSVVFHDYAYIGTYWKKGNESYGGCHYKNDVIEQLQKLGELDRINEVEAACSSGNAIPTNDVDQNAYALYQTKIMLKARKNLFGLSDTTSSGCFGKKISSNLTQIVNDKTILKTMENISISEVLKMNQSSIDNVNEQLYQSVLKANPGTRQSVVTAGEFLVSTFAAYGYRLPYLFTGGHYDYITNKNGVNINYPNTSYYGINPYFGSAVYQNGKLGYYSNDTKKTYYYSGLDCSGFVSWALHNGGIDIPIFTAKDYLEEHNQIKYHFTVSDVSKKNAKIGDVLAKSNHVALVIDVNYSGSNQYITYLEEVGDGLVVSKSDINSSKYLNSFKVVNMDGVYANRKTQDFSNKFKNGLIKEG